MCRMKGKEKCPAKTSAADMRWSWLGSFVGIMLVAWLNHYLTLESMDEVFLISSFGSSAVLIYGSPHSSSAQPRSLIGGHLLGALIGVSVYQLLPLQMFVLAAIAVSLSVFCMQLSNTFHPPAGATALTAVIGSHQIHDMGFYFILMPVLPSAVILLIVALLVNNLSNDDYRHYPRYWI